MNATWSATVYEANGRVAAVLGIPDRIYGAGSALTDVAVTMPSPIEDWNAADLVELIRQAQEVERLGAAAGFDPNKVYHAFDCTTESEWKAALRCEVRVYSSEIGLWEINAVGRIRRGEGARVKVFLNEIAPGDERLTTAFVEAVEWSRRVTET